ncbi:MAG: Maf family protein [Dehalococcoidales bacterium]|nr:Maf family protein [Dehalococcoidales bacterium]
MKKIVLASASPRRRELLEQIGLRFEVEASDCPEEIPPELPPHELAQRLSREKARVVAGKHRNAVIIAADTIGIFRDNILGKPATAAEARSILQTLSGQPHSVITGFTIIDTGTSKTVSRSVETRVYIKQLTIDEIDAYVASWEPLDKAGAYAIQGLGAVIVERIEGDYSNVVGLPLNALAESLKEFDIRVLK